MTDILMQRPSTNMVFAPEHSRQSAIMAGAGPITARVIVGSGQPAALGVAGWLSLAATPTFAIMALISGISASGQPDMICSSMDDMSPLTGMVPMYLLMSAFHLTPWLKLVSGRRSGALLIRQD